MSAAQVSWLGGIPRSEGGVIGGKAARLSILAEQWPVPAGFCVPMRVLDKLNREALQNLVTEAYSQLCIRCGSGPVAVAVRSSSSDEDGGMSAAGQFTTKLNVAGAPSIARAIMAVRCSLRRAPNGNGSVIVQHFVTGDVSAVVFSADPVSRQRDRVVVNTTWGLAASIVGGTVTPDRYVIHKDTLGVAEFLIADKQRMTVPSRRGVRTRSVPPAMRKVPALDDANAQRVAALTIEVERAFGWAVDLECTRVCGVWYLLQCRPVTTMRS